VLLVRDLRVSFGGPSGRIAALDGISFEVARGDALALIGESGSGKSTVALSLLRLLPEDAHASGSVQLFGEDLLQLPEASMSRVRGSSIAMVFHDPLAAMNPVLRIGTQIAEGLRAHGRARRATAAAAAIDLLRTVGLPPETARRYPHELSGGMRQRALIAAALACGPSLLVADEPTSALDAVTQRNLAALLQSVRRERGIGLIVATHDLELAAELCDRIAVLYAGRIVERGALSDVFSRPRHPYTDALLRSLPPPLGDPPARLVPVPGSPPPSWARPSGCAFRDRCSRALPDCASAVPELIGSGGREVACFHPVEAA
jgi:oligopeptide/dipeptide ABC transporter ATP-binding protein